jgi:hypothetical protein
VCAIEEVAVLSGCAEDTGVNEVGIERVVGKEAEILTFAGSLAGSRLVAEQ